MGGIEAEIGKAARGWTLDARDGPARPDILAIAEEVMAASVDDAVAAARGRLLARIGWAAARARLARQGSVGVVLADARGVPDTLTLPVLPLLEALATSGDARIVVTLDLAQIDVFAANLCAPGIELLCAPSAGDRLAALSLAGVPHRFDVNDIGRESEATRLRRLHEEVARIAETLARLTREERAREDEPRGRSFGEPGMGYRGGPATGGAPDITARDIREAIRARRLRDQYFGQGLFEDPAWDMLLDLFAAELERAQVSVSSLCIAAAVAPTTALRWIARMTDAGLFERQPDPFDRRRAYMGLSPRASAGMRNYFAAVRRSGGAVA